MHRSLIHLSLIPVVMSTNCSEPGYGLDGRGGKRDGGGHVTHVRDYRDDTCETTRTTRARLHGRHVRDGPVENTSQATCKSATLDRSNVRVCIRTWSLGCTGLHDVD